jgi:tRNA pseudouridine32 synthase/23S rRNA pseudouridine746 synthase
VSASPRIEFQVVRVAGAPCDALPPVLHADDWLLVVDKPAGMLSVAGRGPAGEDCLHARLRRRWPDARVVHRLDMATSGLIVFARGEQSQRVLSRAFAGREVDKRYVALVAGRPKAGSTNEEGWAEIDLPLAADWPARPRQKVAALRGKPSLTRWRMLGEAVGPWGKGALLELQPVTGRSHQLRVHLAAIGHPIVGDALYAPEDIARASQRLMLHAESLSLAHPADGRPVSWRCAASF